MENAENFVRWIFDESKKGADNLFAASDCCRAVTMSNFRLVSGFVRRSKLTRLRY